MVPMHIYDQIASNREKSTDFMDEQIIRCQLFLGIGEWEFMAAFTVLTVVLFVVKLSSNVTHKTLGRPQKSKLDELKKYLKR